MIAVALSAVLGGSAMAGYTNIYTTTDLADWRDLGGLGIDSSTSVLRNLPCTYWVTSVWAS